MIEVEHKSLHAIFWVMIENLLVLSVDLHDHQAWVKCYDELSMFSNLHVFMFFYDDDRHKCEYVILKLCKVVTDFDNLKAKKSWISWHKIKNLESNLQCKYHDIMAPPREEKKSWFKWQVCLLPLIWYLDVTQGRLPRSKKKRQLYPYKEERLRFLMSNSQNKTFKPLIIKNIFASDG